MSTGGLSRARLGRMHDIMAGYVERGDVPGSAEERSHLRRSRRRRRC